MKMKNTILVTSLLIAAVLLSGCATIVTGKYQDVSVTSDPPGAKVSTTDGLSVTTPGTLKLARKQCYTLTAEYPGAQPQQKELKREVQGWFWGNFLIVSVTGCVTDLASGSAYKLIPDKVNFNFANIGVAAANCNCPYLQTRPDTIGPTRFAGLNEPRVKSANETSVD